MCRENDRRISEAAQMARRGGGSKDLSMEAEQTAWLAARYVPTTNSDAKYTWHCAPEAKVSEGPVLQDRAAVLWIMLTDSCAVQRSLLYGVSASRGAGD
jgi:hypothetical protein